VFRWRVIVSTFFLILLAILLLGGMSVIEKEDVRGYHQLLKSSNPTIEKPSLLSSRGKQQRTNVHKSIILNKPSGRLCLILASDSSELVFSMRKGKIDVVEHFQNLACDMQEDLYYTFDDGREVLRKKDGTLQLKDTQKPVEESCYSSLIPYQRIRHVDADTATYYYGSDLFVAERVNLSRYVLPSHFLEKPFSEGFPLMKGIARSVQFSFVGQRVHFRAYRMKATLYPQGGFF